MTTDHYWTVGPVTATEGPHSPLLDCNGRFELAIIKTTANRRADTGSAIPFLVSKQCDHQFETIREPLLLGMGLAEVAWNVVTSLVSCEV